MSLALIANNNTQPLPPHSASLTYKQLIAALEVFGRKTHLVDMIMSPEMRGVFRPKTVGDFVDLLKFAQTQAGPDKETDANDLVIFRFYNERRQLAAIGVAQFVHDAEEIRISSEAQVRLSEPEIDLVPDPNVICITAKNDGAFVSIESLLPNESLLPKHGMGQSFRDAFNALDASLPSHHTRTKIVARIGQALADAGPLM